MKSSLLAGLALASASLLTNLAQAAPVTGTANISGNATVTSTSILFNPSFVSDVAVGRGSFSGLSGGVILALTGGPVTGATSMPGFVMFTSGVASPVIFDLTNITPGSGTAGACSSSAVGSTCTPAGSPFTLTQLTSSTVLATLQVSGNAYTGSAATGTSPTSATFSSQFVVPGSIPLVLAAVGTGGISNTYSATFTVGGAPPSISPEPASLLLFGTGLIGVVLLTRRKIKAA